MSLHPTQSESVTSLDLGEGGLAARSQSRRILQGLRTAATVELDFAGITEIGPPFADEMFRVFAQAHPQSRITPLNTAPAVAQMIKRAVAARAAQAPHGGSGKKE
jgi:hypothetical protein